jgi:hypothetical protein
VTHSVRLRERTHHGPIRRSRLLQIEPATRRVAELTPQRRSRIGAAGVGTIATSAHSRDHEARGVTG